MWPLSRKYSARYRVEDLIPIFSRSNFSKLKAVFIAESPHKDEVSSENPRERSPFRGTAGKEWWGALSKIAGDQPISGEIPSREKLLEICFELGIVVMNAVQFPLDPKITLHQGHSCDPVEFLGFQKSSGPLGYKAVLKNSDRKNSVNNPVGEAILDLRMRLEGLKKSNDVSIIVCLGNDSRWFVERAAQGNLDDLKIQTIPHPSSWWRKAEYRSRALKLLEDLLG